IGLKNIAYTTGCHPLAKCRACTTAKSPSDSRVKNFFLSHLKTCSTDELSSIFRVNFSRFSYSFVMVIILTDYCTSVKTESNTLLNLLALDSLYICTHLDCLARSTCTGISPS